MRLDPNRTPAGISRLREQLSQRVVGQPKAVETLVRLYARSEAGLVFSSRPLANVLLLGPTGTGKTYIVETFTELLHPDSQHPIRPLRIDCGELQHSHEIARLIGSPPGYLGHRETLPAINNEILSKQKTIACQFSVVLFDEIEKASDAVHKLLLGIMDRGQLTLGDNSTVDLSTSMIFMTSNIGAREIADTLEGSPFGFQKLPSRSRSNLDRSARNAARKKLPPEFWNRLDETIVFEPLQEEHIRQIVRLELRRLQTMAWENNRNKKFLILADDSAQELILRTGLDLRYGARHVRRSIDQHLLQPLATLVLSQQIDTNDVILISAEDGHMVFHHALRTSPEGLLLGFDLAWNQFLPTQEVIARLQSFVPQAAPKRRRSQGSESKPAELAHSNHPAA